MRLAIPYPAWLSPEIIPGFPFRWYGLMYLFAFATAYFVFMIQVKERKPAWTEDDVSGLFFWAILGLLVGARVFATIVYDTSGIYAAKPWLVFWPFMDGKFVGLQGMSYHGGVIGATITIIAYTLKRKMGVRVVGDYMTTAIPLGYTFGRLGNFINGELYGRVTDGPLGMVFPHAERFSVKLPWVREIAEKTGIAISSAQASVNLPRHASQLYEALFEGIVLWAILWFLRNRKPFKGFIIGAYMIGYGVFRFVIEYFREPDADIGYRIRLVNDGVPPALYSNPFNFSTGQILCALMVVGGIVWWIIA
ncbi:MAG: prolipoprotein diacylglyceryl transferase, partial [Treponemataceae bacterium]